MWTCDINQVSKDNNDANDSSNEGPFYESLVYDYEENFQLQRLKPEHKPLKETFKSHLKRIYACLTSSLCDSLLITHNYLGYIKKVNDCLKDGGCDETTIRDFQRSASNVINHILENYDSYEVLLGASLDPDAMSVNFASLFLPALTE